MDHYAVSLFLDECPQRGQCTALPGMACVLTRLIQADSFLEAVALACPGEDCRRIEINRIYGDPITKGG